MNKIELIKIEDPNIIKILEQRRNIYNQIDNNMKICSNCGTQLSCGCQRRTASDGTLCCDQCVSAYETKITPPKPIPLPETKAKKNSNDAQS